jgi:hypothetical protein
MQAQRVNCSLKPPFLSQNKETMPENEGKNEKEGESKDWEMKNGKE